MGWFHLKSSLLPPSSAFRYHPRQTLVAKLVQYAEGISIVCLLEFSVFSWFTFQVNEYQMQTKI